MNSDLIMNLEINVRVGSEKSESLMGVSYSPEAPQPRTGFVFHIFHIFLFQELGNQEG